jgi:XapX domain-containing protein
MSHARTQPWSRRVLAYAMSLLVGIAIGAAYGALQPLTGVRSPAPPVIALVGLLGILIGETAVTRWRTTSAPASPAPAATQPAPPAP